jgi:hypothetical protein
MRVIISCRVKVHESARDRFIEWSRHHARSFAALKAELEQSQGHPAGAMDLGNGQWVWAAGGTLVSYVLKDEPVGAFALFVDRSVVITDVFAV